VGGCIHTCPRSFSFLRGTASSRTFAEVAITAVNLEAGELDTPDREAMLRDPYIILSQRMDGIPPGSADAVLAILRSQTMPMRRRKILAELEARGHRISLAGLNRILEYCTRNQLISDGPDGIRVKPPSP